MSYLDSSDAFSTFSAFPCELPEDLLPASAEPAGFQQTEWAIIALARNDGLGTLQEPRRSKLGRLVMGQPRTYTLAAEPLEVLRRLAVEAWHRPLAISISALGAFIAAGFSSDQLGLLLSATGALRAMAGLHGGPPEAA